MEKSGYGGTVVPDLTWIHTSMNSPPPLSQTPKDFLLKTSTAVIEEDGMEGPLVVTACLCSPDCEQECCQQRATTQPVEHSSDSESSNEATPLLANQPPRDRSQPSALPDPACPSTLPDPTRCACHVKQPSKTSTKARNKLIAACIMALIFMIGEIVGGYLSASLAILTDAAHMLSDFASFLISLFAIWVASRKPSNGMSFGWHRAEVLGAVISVLIIWVVTGVLVYEAIQRCIHRDFEINADVMLITACAGVFVNVFMIAVLHQHGHGHSHGGAGGGHGHGGGGRGTREGEGAKRGGLHNKNINVHAAFIHVLGDLIQSIGIVIAGYIIWFKPEWKLADPVCTFLFSILVLVSTLNILKDTLRVLMEGTPKHINYEAVKADLAGIEGVKHAHSLQIWSLTLNRTALAVHLALEPGANNQDVLQRASCMLKERYDINHTTLQVEAFQPSMEDCYTCQNVRTPSRLRNFFKLCRNSSADRRNTEIA